MIKAVVFDLDNTLMDFMKMKRSAIEAAFPAMIDAGLPAKEAEYKSIIDEIYKEKEALPLTQKLIEENQLENLAQIFTNKRYTKKDNVHFSQSFLKVIENAGFMNNFE